MGATREESRGSEANVADIESLGHNVRLIAEIVARATEMFGSADHAIEWLNTPIVPFHNRSPFDLMTIEPDGMQQVQDELTRIEHGVLA